MILERFPNVKTYVCASGVTPSGKIHLGNFIDLCLADAVKRVLIDEGYNAKHVFVIDSHDPFREPPIFAPKDFIARADEFKGIPFSQIPDPWGCHESFAKHFVAPVVEHMRDYGMNFEVVWGEDLHRDPRYVNVLAKVLEGSERVREILNDVRRRAGHRKLYPEGWIPYRPQCENCGIIDERVKALRYERFKVEYKCEKCGFEGEVDVRSGRGKPPWRVDWAIRWIALNVHFEPLGKDHMASGSSYDTARALLRRFFNRLEPVSIFYDFVYLRSDGRYLKFSKRKGIGLGVDEWLKYAPPEVLRFMILRKDVKDISCEAISHWFFDPKEIPRYVEDFDMWERMYFNLGKVPEKQRERVKLTYILSITGEVPRFKPSRIPYLTAAIIAQRAKGNVDEAIRILQRIKILPQKLSELEYRDACRRLTMALNWVRDYGREYSLLSDKVPEEALKLSDKEYSILRELLSVLESGTVRGENIKGYVRELAIKVYGNRKYVRRAFQAVYLAVSGKPYGPPLDKLIFEMLGLELACRRIRKVLELKGYV